MPYSLSCSWYIVIVDSSYSLEDNALRKNHPLAVRFEWIDRPFDDGVDSVTERSAANVVARLVALVCRKSLTRVCK